MANLLATKPITIILNEAQETGEHSLKRALGPSNLIALGIGAIIGIGIFVITGTATAQHAGPAIILSFVFAATDLVLEYAFGAATVASGWSGYFISLLGDFGIKLPASIAGTHWDEFIFYNNHWEPVTLLVPKLKTLGIDPATLPHAHGAFNLLGFLAIVITTLILVIGIKESANFNSAIVIIKVCVLIVFIGIGINYLSKHHDLLAQNWHPFIPPNIGEFGQFGTSGILRAAGIIFFAYIGFDAVSTAAQEAKNPEKDMPLGILGSLAICTILYILVAGVLTGLVNYRNLNVPDPLAIGIDSTGVRWV